MSNLLIGSESESALKMVFSGVRPWALNLFALHALMLYLWEYLSCGNPSHGETPCPKPIKNVE